MKQLILALLLVPTPCLAASDPEALRVVESARIASAGGRDITPTRIEIEAVYHYADEEEPIIDRTEIEPGRRLLQEREIGGRTIRRGWQTDSAFVEGPDGRTELDAALRDDLEVYFCRRLLDFLILCPGTELSLGPTRGEHQVILAHREDLLLGQLELDRRSLRLVSVRYPESPTVDTSAPAPDEETFAESTFSEFRNVDGWSLPHHVDTRIEGQLVSSYSIERIRLISE